MAQTTQPVVAVVGSAMIDLVAYVQRAPGAGETVPGERFVIGFGGKGSNQAVMARRLGAVVPFVGCVGDDAYGTMTLEHLRSEGVGTAALAARPGSTGVAPIWVEPDGTNRIVVVPGANALVTAQDAASAVRELDRVDAVIGQLEIPQAATAAGLAAGRGRGATTVLNPAPFTPLTPELLAVVDWLVPNEVEFALLVDAHDIGGLTHLGGPGQVSQEQVLALSQALGCCVAVTLGARGVALTVNGGVELVAAPPAVAVDTTGAGDAFVGAFAVALAEGTDIPDAARLACACATWSVQRDGAQTSFPTPQEAARLRVSGRDQSGV